MRHSPLVAKAAGGTAPPQRKPQCDGEWADAVDTLKLTSSESRFYEWKPGIPIHYVQQGDTGVNRTSYRHSVRASDLLFFVEQSPLLLRFRL